MSKLCKLGHRGCWANGECHYKKRCENQIADTGKWKFSDDCACWVCSECGAAALNDYAGRSTPSTFCPHCGKPMILAVKEAARSEKC